MYFAQKNLKNLFLIIPLSKYAKFQLFDVLCAKELLKEVIMQSLLNF